VEGEDLMAEQRHGRYYAQELTIDPALDADERLEWHLLGVSDVLPERGVILFWDTASPSFARRGR